MKKNPMLTLAIFAGAAGLLYYWLRRKASAAQNLIIEPMDVLYNRAKTKRARYLTFYYSVVLNLINNEPADINVRQVNLNVKLNGRNWGRIIQNTPFRVPRRGNKIQKFDTSFNMVNVLFLIPSLISDGFKFEFDVSGYINTDLGRVDIAFQKNYDIDFDFDDLLNNKYQDSRIKTVNGPFLIDYSNEYNQKKNFT